MRVLSLCSGVGGLDRGLEQAGMEVVALCEIDPTCREVLARHWPGVPCHDDITTMDGSAWRGRIDVVAGGSPCTDLSVAGRRAGLGGESSRIFWDFCRVADQSAADWVVFENVAGLLSSNDGEDFAAVLWGLTGFRPAVPEDGWRTVGMCIGPHRTAVWRLLDARWFGVPQRRRRVYVVAGPGSLCGPEVLLEPESCGWDPHPRQPAGSGPASASGTGAQDAGVVGTLTHPNRPDDNTVQAGHLVADEVGTLGTSGPGSGWRIGPDEAAAGQLIPALTASQQRYDDQQTGQLITEGVEDIASAVTAKWAKGVGGPAGDECQNLVPFVKRQRAHHPEDDESWGEGELAPTLTPNDLLGERATVLAIQEGAHGVMLGDEAGALAGPGGKPGQGYGAVLIADEEAPVLGFDSNWSSKQCFTERNEELGSTIKVDAPPAVAYPLAARGRDDGTEWEVGEEGVYNALRAGDGGSSRQPSLLTSMAVRRLTPRECERLMSWPDDHTRFRPDGSELADSSRYRQCGNGVVSNVTAWIGRRIPSTS